MYKTPVVQSGIGQQRIFCPKSIAKKLVAFWQKCTEYRNKRKYIDVDKNEQQYCLMLAQFDVEYFLLPFSFSLSVLV